MRPNNRPGKKEHAAGRRPYVYFSYIRHDESCPLYVRIGLTTVDANCSCNPEIYGTNAGLEKRQRDPIEDML